MKQLAAEQRDGMSTIVQTVTHWVSPFIILYGFFILSVGNRAPGGAFASGVILACGLILLMLAYGRHHLTRLVSLPVARTLLSAGIILFWLTAASGLVFGDWFFANYLAQRDPVGQRGTGIIMLCGLGIALAVAAALVLVLLALSVLRVKAGESDDELVTDIED